MSCAYSAMCAMPVMRGRFGASAAPSTNEANSRGIAARFVSGLLFPAPDRLAQTLSQPLRLAPPWQTVILINLVAVAHQGSRITDKLPPDQSRIPAVHRIGKHAFDRVGPQQLKKQGLLDCPQRII